MFTRLLIQTTFSLVCMGLLLFIPIGTINWWAAWVFLLENGIGSLAIGIWLAKYDPALLKERLSFVIQSEQKRWDKILVTMLFLLMIIWLPLMALDAMHYNYSYFPPLIQVVGAFGIVITMCFIYFTFHENTYAAPVVKIQKERQQKVISTGLYSYVRHPMYTGILFFFFGTPLLLGSWYGLIFAFPLSVLLALRAYMEEQTLMKELDGYSAYMKRVRYRLIPYIW